MNEFKRLAEPLRIGSMSTNNRIWMAPMWTRMASPDGEVTQTLIDHYVARAKGGVGQVCQEATAVDGLHRWTHPQVRIDDDKFCTGLHKLVEAVHMHNVPIMIQLHHTGMFGPDPVAPSEVASFEYATRHYIQPRALSIPEIEDIRDKFIQAAVRAQALEYDAIEIHGSTAYLLEQFFSPHANKRTDKYGGSFEGRTLLWLEILRGIRQRCGPEYPVGFSVIDSDLIPGGVVIEESLRLAKVLEQEGASYIDIQTTGTYETFHTEQARGRSGRQKRGMFDIAAKFKKELRVPVTARAAGERDPLVWEKAIENGEADVVRTARPLLADPELASKVLAGKPEDVRACLGCNYCFEVGIIKNFQLACAVNYGAGRGERQGQRAPASRKVLVIGGGPAGLEASRVAAQRGHDVTMVEKEASVGGNLVTASLPVAKDALGQFVGWADRQCRQLGVKIELKKEATPALVQKLKPDVVIVATGAIPSILQVPGVDKPHVVIAADVLAGKAKVGKRVVVAGGGAVGLETADFIIEKGLAKDVTMLEQTTVIGADMNPVDRTYMMANVVPKIGLKIVTSTYIEAITDTGVIGIDREWQRHEFKADTIVLATGYSSNRAVYEALKGKVPELYLIGDARNPRKIANAIHEGAFVAEQI